MFFWPLRSHSSSFLRIEDNTFEKNARVHLPVLPVQHLAAGALEGRRGAADGHSDPFYKKVLSPKFLKLGKEFCYNRNGKDNVVLFWAEGFRSSKTRVLL